MKQNLCKFCSSSRLSAVSQSGKVLTMRCLNCGAVQFLVERKPGDKNPAPVKCPLKASDIHSLKVTFEPNEEVGCIEFSVGPAKLAIVEHFTDLPADQDSIAAWLVRRYSFVILQCIIGETGWTVPITRIVEDRPQRVNIVRIDPDKLVSLPLTAP